MLLTPVVVSLVPPPPSLQHVAVACMHKHNGLVCNSDCDVKGATYKATGSIHLTPPCLAMQSGFLTPCPLSHASLRVNWVPLPPPPLQGCCSIQVSCGAGPAVPDAWGGSRHSHTRAAASTLPAAGELCWLLREGGQYSTQPMIFNISAAWIGESG